MLNFLKSRWLEILIGLTALIAGLIATVPALLELLASTGSARIIAVNAIYLENAASESLQDTLLLGEIAALLEVVKSTDFGIELIVSVDVQIGQVLSGLTRAIEWAMFAAAGATVASHALQFVNGIADQLSVILFLGLLWAVALWMLLRLLPVAGSMRTAGRAIAETLAVLFVLSYLVLPYAINVTGRLSESLAGSLHPDTQTTVTQLHDDTLQGGSLSTDLGYWTNSSNLRAVYQEVTADLHDKVSALTRYAVMRIANLIVVGLLFPLSVVLILTLVLRRLTKLALDGLEATGSTTVAAQSQAADSSTAATGT